jgi:LmeA-like phospholipid-binding
MLSGMRRLVIAGVILLALLVAVDRIAAVVASRAVARQVRSELALDRQPSVSVHGFPFLTQAMRGRYSDIEVRIPDVDSGPLQDIEVDARLRDLRAPLSDMVGGRLDAVPVREITGTLAVHYDDLARASGIQGLRITQEGDDALRLSGTVEVLGREFEASATAQVSVLDEDLAITADNAEIAGVQAPASLRAAAAELLSFRVSPSELPLDLRVTGVATERDQLTVAARARDVVLRRGEIDSGEAGSGS